MGATRDVHEGVVVESSGMLDCIVKITGKFRKCLERQVTEGILIDEFEKGGGKLLNSINEYFTPKKFKPFSSSGETSPVWQA